jgi:hypothetical protein
MNSATFVEIMLSLFSSIKPLVFDFHIVSDVSKILNELRIWVYDIYSLN